MNQRRFSEAEQSIKESQEIARQAEGPAGFWSLSALNRLGWIAERQGRESEAEAHFLEALHTAEKELARSTTGSHSSFWASRIFITVTGEARTSLRPLSGWQRLKRKTWPTRKSGLFRECR